MSLHTSRAQNQACKHGDRRHTASIACQRQHVTATPRQQAEAIAALVRKRIADQQPIPDLDRYPLTDATWAELYGVLGADELSAVVDACGGDSMDDLDDLVHEPSAADIKRAFVDDVQLIPGRPVPQQAPQVAHDWHNAFPVHTHSLSWTDSDGMSHSHTVRSDDMDEVLRQVKIMKVVIAAAKARDAKASIVPAQETLKPEGWCDLHGMQMKRNMNERGLWWSHKTSDGWCHGKTKA